MFLLCFHRLMCGAASEKRPWFHTSFYLCLMADQQTPLLIVGTGADARIALDIANALDILLYGFLTQKSDEALQELNDILIIATLDSKDGLNLMKEENLLLVVAEEDIEKRRALVAFVGEYQKVLGRLVHPAADISAYARLGHGLIIDAYTSIGPNAIMGSHGLVGMHCSIGADACIGDFCTLRNGVRIGRGVEIAEGVFIGSGAIIQSGIKVGKEAMISPGAVVMKEVPPKARVYGNPAQEI